MTYAKLLEAQRQLDEEVCEIYSLLQYVVNLLYCISTHSRDVILQVSVASIETSSTDRYIAAKKSTRVSPVLDRYDSLIPLLIDGKEDQQVDPRLPTFTKTKKQV